jgi:hypothetical protein
MTAGERSNLVQRSLKTPAGQWRKFFAETEIFDRNGQPPRRRAAPEKLPRERQQRARVRSVRHELCAFGGFELAHLDFSGGVHGGVHKNHRARLGNLLCEFGRELVAHEGDNAGQGQLGYRGGHLRPHAVIAAQSIAVANDQKIGAGGFLRIVTHVGRLNHWCWKTRGETAQQYVKHFTTTARTYTNAA